MSQLKFWAKQNHNNNNSSNIKDTTNNNNESATNGTSNDSKHGKRNWLHTPEALMNGHVVYLVKFFGNLPVEQAKGIEVVKETIRKLQFAQQMKKAETGTQEKHKKVEITISCDGVAVQEPRTNNILHQFPLHNISYCADEKGVKKFFSFIAKSPQKDGVSNGTTGGSSNGSTDEAHECFVFISNKLASDITLTIGQAFDLAYKKFMNNAEKSDLDKAHQQVADLEKTIAIYKNRLRELSLKLPKAELDGMLFKMNIKDILEVASHESSAITNGSKSTNDNDKMLIDTSSTKSTSASSATSAFAPIVPPRNNMPSQNKSNSQKMDELLLNSDSDSDFDPRAEESMDSGSGSKSNDNDLFGFEPSKSYGQQLFHNNNDNKLLNANSNSNIINNISSHSFMSNDLNLTPPLLAPPPKVAAPRRSTSVTGNNNGNNVNMANGNDLFGSDPFDINGPSIFQKNTISVDDFSLESLDPLRK